MVPTLSFLLSVLSLGQSRTSAAIVVHCIFTLRLLALIAEKTTLRPEWGRR